MPQTNFELRRKLLQLEALYDVGRALNTLRPEGELLEELMQRAVAVLDAMIGFVFSLDEKLNVQHLYTWGIDLPTPSNIILNEPPVRQVLASVQASFLAAAFDAIRNDYGDLENYLSDALGLGAGERAKLEARYLDC